MSHDCELHADNQGFCFTCSRPVNSEYYAAYCGTETYNNQSGAKFKAEWAALVTDWELKHEH